MGFRDELVYGRIIVSPQPKPLHFVIADNIYERLKKAAGQKYRAVQRMNLRFLAAKSMPSPDVFVISREAFQLALRANGYPEGSATILAVEVLSPSNRKKHIDSKVELYLDSGIEVWVVNPKKAEIKVHKGDEVRTFGPNGEGKLPVPAQLGGKAIPLKHIFSVG